MQIDSGGALVVNVSDARLMSVRSMWSDFYFVLNRFNRETIFCTVAPLRSKSSAPARSEVTCVSSMHLSHHVLCQCITLAYGCLFADLKEKAIQTRMNHLGLG